MGLFGNAVLSIVQKLPEGIAIKFSVEAKLVNLYDGSLGVYGLIHEWFDRALVRAIRLEKHAITWADMLAVALHPIQLSGIVDDLIKYREVMSGVKTYLKEKMDLGYRLDIPPACLGSAETALTDPDYWRQRPVMSLDKPHVRPTQQKIEVVKAELATRLALQDSSSAPAPEGLPRLAKRLQVSLGVLKRHFPEECAKLIAQRKAVLRTRVDAETKAKTERVAAAAAAVVSQGRRATDRSLKQTGLVKVSDLVPTLERSMGTPREK